MYFARAPTEMSRIDASAPNAFSDLDQYPRCEESRTSRAMFPRFANAPNPIVLPAASGSTSPASTPIAFNPKPELDSRWALGALGALADLCDLVALAGVADAFCEDAMQNTNTARTMIAFFMIPPMWATRRISSRLAASEPSWTTEVAARR